MKGHSGDPDNERVDQLARAQALAIQERGTGNQRLMRQIVLDTETTGLSWERGNRVVEIGCVELVERRPTGRTFQRYLNPEREFEPGAQEVTGLTWEFLADKPQFADVVDEFLAFIEGAELVIHNAAFDVGFLDYELSRLGRALRAPAPARAGWRIRWRWRGSAYPGQRNSLDALVPAAGRGLLAPPAARRAARCATAGRSLPGADVGPERNRVRQCDRAVQRRGGD